MRLSTCKPVSEWRAASPPGARSGKCETCGRWGKRSSFDRTENWEHEAKGGHWVARLHRVWYHCKGPGRCHDRGVERGRLWYQERFGEAPGF